LPAAGADMRTSNTMRMIQLSGTVALASGERINEAADISCCDRSKTRRANAARMASLRRAGKDNCDAIVAAVWVIAKLGARCPLRVINGHRPPVRPICASPLKAELNEEGRISFAPLHIK